FGLLDSILAGKPLLLSVRNNHQWRGAIPYSTLCRLSYRSGHDRRGGRNYKLLHFDAVSTGAKNCACLGDWPRHQHHRRASGWTTCHCLAGWFHWNRYTTQFSFRRSLWNRDRGDVDVIDGWYHHLARFIASDYGQRG